MEQYCPHLESIRLASLPGAKDHWWLLRERGNEKETEWERKREKRTNKPRFFIRRERVDGTGFPSSTFLWEARPRISPFFLPCTREMNEKGIIPSHHCVESSRCKMHRQPHFSLSNEDAIFSRGWRWNTLKTSIRKRLTFKIHERRLASFFRGLAMAKCRSQNTFVGFN